MTPTESDSTARARPASICFERERGVTRVEVSRGLSHATVRFAGDDLAARRLALLQALASAAISIFMIKLHPRGLSFAVRDDAVDACERLLQEREADYDLLRGLGLVAPVAGAMRDLSGIMARIYQALVDAGVNVRQTGDAHNTVILLVAESDLERAKAALERAFGIDGDGGAPERGTA